MKEPNNINEAISMILELKDQQAELEGQIRSVIHRPEFLRDLMNEHPYAFSIDWSKLRRSFGHRRRK